MKIEAEFPRRPDDRNRPETRSDAAPLPRGSTRNRHTTFVRGTERDRRRQPIAARVLHPGMGTVALCLLLGLSLCTVPAGADQFAVIPGEPNLIRFDSKAPAESFSGKTRQVQGTAQLNPANLSDSIFVHMEVDLASLDTGIDLRNRHMRENHLETDTYPKVTFTSRKLLNPSSPALRRDSKTTFTLEGPFNLHGVTQIVQIPFEATLVEKDGKPAIHAVAHFPVNLPDYKIARPKFLILRLDEVQRITVDVVAVGQ